MKALVLCSGGLDSTVLLYKAVKEAEEYYYKTYPVTLNIGEEERKKKFRWK